MLWAYFDESGWHPNGGALAKLTVGGCIASFETWEALSLNWASAIENMGIPYFHMTDFEARQRPYENWTREGEETVDVYKRCAHDVLLELGLYEDEFAIVFAHHPEFAAYSPLHQMLMQWGAGKQIKNVTIGQPLDLCPLQAADIVAYEIRCQEREELRPMRYPMKRLHELGCTFRLASAVE
jgi:hypothetical protein